MFINKIIQNKFKSESSKILEFIADEDDYFDRKFDNQWIYRTIDDVVNITIGGIRFIAIFTKTVDNDYIMDLESVIYNKINVLPDENDFDLTPEQWLSKKYRKIEEILSSTNKSFINSRMSDKFTFKIKDNRVEFFELYRTSKILYFLKTTNNLGFIDNMLYFLYNAYLERKMNLLKG